jgi:hypothetical protein
MFCWDEDDLSSLMTFGITRIIGVLRVYSYRSVVEEGNSGGAITFKSTQRTALCTMERLTDGLKYCVSLFFTLCNA